MKKEYLTPENTVISLAFRENCLQDLSNLEGTGTGSNMDDPFEFNPF